MLQPYIGLHRYLFRFLTQSRAGSHMDYYWSRVRFLRWHERTSLACIVAPSTILLSQLLGMDFPVLPASVVEYLPFVAYVMAAFSALRLAKFNLDERQTMGFIGLPTPANALFWASLIVFAGNFFTYYAWGGYALILMMFVSCYLLVAEIPMFALKFKHWGFKGNEIRYTFLALAAVIILAFTIANGLDGFLSSWWIVISVYVLFSVIFNMAERQAKA